LIEPNVTTFSPITPTKNASGSDFSRKMNKEVAQLSGPLFDPEAVELEDVGIDASRKNFGIGYQCGSDGSDHSE
jgi:hypothetical protein